MSLPNRQTISDRNWNSWKWQLSQAKSSAAASDCICREVEELYPSYATPFYLSLAKSDSPDDPVIRQSIPQKCELLPGGEDDPLSEESDSPVPRLVHRYQDRALLLTCSTCAVHCRHCMRKRLWQQPPLRPLSQPELEQMRQYLAKHTEIREILISGGDPLTMTDANIGNLLDMLESVPNIEMLRIGTRTLVALPQRFTPALCRRFAKSNKTIWIATHFNHPQEISAEAEAAVRSLMKAGVPVVNQCVLLKGINDNAETLGKLFTELLRIRIKPYYLFHGDPIRGTACFRTGVQAGLDILKQLHHNLTGMALPAFAFDLPDGGGKIRLEPDFTAGKDLYYTRTGSVEQYP